MDFMMNLMRLLECFPGSKLNSKGEFIVDERNNIYFILKNCETDLDVKCKVLEWVSRSASSAIPYKTEKKNKRYNDAMRKYINHFLDTDFSQEEMEDIYTYLGNACDHKKTIRFIESGYDMQILRN